MTATEFSSRLNASPFTSACGEVDQFAGHDVGEAVAAGDAVADFQDAAGLADVELLAEIGDLPFDDRGDFARLKL